MGKLIIMGLMGLAPILLVNYARFLKDEKIVEG
jgi:hypothetical protein